MKEEIFRKKSLDQIQSPESLNDYVRVTNPGVWLLLGAVIVLLIGMCLWGIFGRIDSVLKAEVHVEDGRVSCYVDLDNVEALSVGQSVKIGTLTGQLTEITGTEDGQAVCLAEMDGVLKDGLYEADIAVESIRPMSFILN